MNILLLSAYDAASHQYWRQSLAAQFPEHNWTQLALPPRHFNWRLRGNSLSWAFSQRELLSRPYHLVIATDMVDLSALRGMVPSLGAIPTLVYFHENQYAYPASDDQHPSVEPRVLNLYTALCADRILFNSDYNRRTFLEGVAQLLRRLPDEVPDGLVVHLSARSQVLPVPVQADCFARERNKARLLTLVWNHRWEYDKGPDRLLAALQLFCAGKQPFRLHLVGQQFRQRPPVFDDIRRLVNANNAVGEWGYVRSRERYLDLLRDSHLVLSTALHDFQGLSVLEAVAAGCLPLVPRREAYPEWFGDAACYSSEPEQIQQEARALAERLTALAEAFYAGGLPQPPDVSRLGWPQLRETYRQLLEEFSP